MFPQSRNQLPPTLNFSVSVRGERMCVESFLQGGYWRQLRLTSELMAPYREDFTKKARLEAAHSPIDEDGSEIGRMWALIVVDVQRVEATNQDRRAGSGALDVGFAALWKSG